MRGRRPRCSVLDLLVEDAMDEDIDDESVLERESDFWQADQQLGHPTMLAMFRESHVDEKSSKIIYKSQY